VFVLQNANVTSKTVKRSPN